MADETGKRRTAGLGKMGDRTEETRIAIGMKMADETRESCIGHRRTSLLLLGGGSGLAGQKVQPCAKILAYRFGMKNAIIP